MKKMVKKEFLIGIWIIASIVILIFGIDYLKGINLFNPANFYYASYDKITELDVSSPVTINGYKVGQVRSIEFDYKNPGKIKVQLALNKELKVPVDSKAQLETTLMSGSYINLVLGKSDKNLELGGDIPTVQSSDLMSALTNDILPPVEAILPKVDSIMANLNRLTSDPALLATVQRLDGISRDLLSMTNSLNKTIGRDVPGLTSNVNSIAVKLDSVVTDLSVLSNNLKSLPLNSTMENIEALSGNLNDFSKQMINPNSTLGMLTRDPELYDRLNRVAADVDSLIVDIKKNPKRYISIKLL